MIRNRHARIVIICPHCKGLHTGDSEHGGSVDARWRADNKVEQCRAKIELEREDEHGKH